MDFLLEIGTEEIPAKFIPGIVKQLEDKTACFLKEQRLAYDFLTIYSTPRRLSIYVASLAEKQEDQLEVFRGPARNIAFDDTGNPTKAAEGFAKSKGLSVAELQVTEVNGIEYLFAEVASKGKKAQEILEEGLAGLLSSLDFPKSMRWSDHSLRFVRPVRWLLALLDNEVLPVQFAGIKSDRFTYGHRTLAFGPHSIKEPSDYLEVLRKAYVLADYEVRVEMVKAEVERVAAEIGGQALLDEELLEEVVNLVEYPTAFAGSFSKDYLKIPKEILVTSMQVHQRYFPVERDGMLLPYFIGVRNGTDESIDLVRKGNEKVLRARLADADFFFTEDRKKKLEEYVEGQKEVVYQARLGSLYDKTMRVSDLAIRLAGLINLGEADVRLLQRAAYLAKADLLTSVVYEFTELQGVMGREYALLSLEDEVVADAIHDHYLPRFAGDRLPEGNIAQLLALADKIDNIVGSFALGMEPTGSQDPYGLRRQALGILHILKEQPLSVHILIDEATKGLAEIIGDKEGLISKVMEFFKVRLKTILADDGFRYDVIEAVLSSPDSLQGIIGDIYKRATVLQEVATGNLKEEVLIVYRRTENLSRKLEGIQLLSEDYGSEQDRVFYRAMNEFRKNALRLLEIRDYRGFYGEVVALRVHVDRYLDDVMIMVDDEALRTHRLSMLKTVAEVLSLPADLGKLEG